MKSLRDVVQKTIDPISVKQKQAETLQFLSSLFSGLYCLEKKESTSIRIYVKESDVDLVHIEKILNELGLSGVYIGTAKPSYVHVSKL